MKTTLNENIDIPFEIEYIEDEHCIDNIKHNVLKEMILPVVILIESSIDADEAINRVAKDRHLNSKIVLKNCVRLQGFKDVDEFAESVRNGSYKKHLLDKYPYHNVFIECEI